jgi:hypothetical protein
MKKAASSSGLIVRGLPRRFIHPTGPATRWDQWLSIKEDKEDFSDYELKFRI